MSNQIDKNNLGYLGVDFQYKLVKCFMEEPKFYGDIASIVTQNSFTDSLLRTFVGTLKDYYEEIGVVPSYETLLIRLKSRAVTSIELQELDGLVEKLKKGTSLEGYSSIKEMAIKFFQQQMWTKIANKIIDVTKAGDIEQYDACRKLIDEASMIGSSDEDMGFSPFDMIDKALSPTYTVHIPTGIKLLDEALLGGLAKKKVGVIIGSSGFGKALADDEIVITPNGPRMINDLSVGEYVIGRNGKPIIVTGVFPQGKRDIYKVTFNDGTSCRCDLEHIWTVYDAKKNKKENLTLNQIVKNGLLFGSKQRHRYKVPMCQPVEYNSKDVDIHPYVFGYMLGDGCLQRGAITVGKQDEEFLTNKLSEIGCNISVQYHKERATTVSIVKDNIKSKLSEYIDLSCTSSNKFIPDVFKFNSIENRVALLNGLMDSDGTCQKNGCSCFNTKSERLANDIKDIVLSLGGFARVRTKKAGYFSKKYNKHVDCGLQYEVTITLCDESIKIFQNPRKQERVKYRTKYKGAKYIDSVEFVNNQDAICIKVSADDELFLTKDYIVTHNTTLSTCISSYASTFRCDLNNNEGFKVLQIYFEDDDVDMARKHFAKITQVESKDLTSSIQQIDEIKSVLNNYKDKELMKQNLRLKPFKAHEKSASDVELFLKKLINTGWKPDLVIIDYFECLKPERGGFSSDSQWAREAATMRKLENIAKDLDIAIWVPTQGNKESINSNDLVTMDKAGGSIVKVQAASVIISIARSVEQQKDNIATLALIKNRGGSLGVWKNIVFNNGTSTISCDNVIPYDSTKAYEEEEKIAMEKCQNDLLKKLAKNQTNTYQTRLGEDNMPF